MSQTARGLDMGANVTAWGAHVVADVDTEEITKLHGLWGRGQAAEHPHHCCNLPRRELIHFEVLSTAHLYHRHELLQDRVQLLCVRPLESCPPLPDHMRGVCNIQHRVLACPQLLHDVRERRCGKGGPEHAL